MSYPSPRFEWLIDQASSWPPRGRPKPPFGPTMVEVLRSCPLRGCFEASRGYERRISFSGRVGTAFHRVLQSLLEQPPESTAPADMAAEARRRFLSEGTRIVDFKAALRDDLTERYARQVQLYALMWRDTRGEWPVAGEVVYPMRGVAHAVPVAADLCTGVGNEARDVVLQLSRETDPHRLGQPGDVCKACDFRPWCEVFWRWQRDEPAQHVARERAGLGIE